MAKKSDKSAQKGNLKKDFDSTGETPAFKLHDGQPDTKPSHIKADVNVDRRWWFYNERWFGAYLSTDTNGNALKPKDKAGIESVCDTLIANGVQHGWRDMFVEDKSKRMEMALLCQALDKRKAEILRSPDALDILSKPPYGAKDPAATYHALKAMSFHMGNAERDGAKLNPPAAGVAPAA